MSTKPSFIDDWAHAINYTCKDKPLFKVLKVLGITKALRSLYHKYKKRRLISSYGPELKGQITVYGTKFNFHDPSRVYLLRSICGRSYEPAITYHMKSIISDNKICFLDIGAYFGFFTAYIATLNKNCEIHSFEPSEKYFKILHENISMNNINAKIYNIALSDKSGEIPFFDRSMKAVANQTGTVQSTPFDELAAREHIRPDVAKVDVHGGEGKVLYGMKNALQNHIRHIYCEIHPNELLVDYTIKDILDILLETGFELFEIENFRFETSPKFNKITGSLYDNMIDGNKWTEDQIAHRRMIYGTKEPNTGNISPSAMTP
jgi:FkbM family methyltransferase